jgi:F0F1-type ATP synthase assembly protein I
VLRGLAAAAGMALSIGLPFGVLVSSGALAGIWLDRRFDTAPWLTVTGVVVGAIGAFVNLVRVVTMWQRKGG